jgi:hypothetical protein
VVPEGWVPISDRQRGDVAVLEVVGEPPAGAGPAPLRRPVQLRGHAFDATGFPAAAESGLTASGEISRPAGPGGEWVQLDGVRVQGARVEQGFSGTPVWDQQVGAVVGMVVSELVGGDAKVSWMIPLGVISEYWTPLDQAIRVGLLYEPGERAAYWRPRARGVERDEVAGWYFTGRLAVLRKLVAWLTAPRVDGQVQVVTGGPGAGKSGVVAWLVLTSDWTEPADPQLQAHLAGRPADAVLPPAASTRRSWRAANLHWRSCALLPPLPNFPLNWKLCLQTLDRGPAGQQSS